MDGNVRNRSNSDRNCTVDWKNPFEGADGIFRIPVLASRDITKGEKLSYSYNYNSGYQEAFIADSSASDRDCDLVITLSFFGLACKNVIC
jgi:hypothetical protein